MPKHCALHNKCNNKQNSNKYEYYNRNSSNRAVSDIFKCIRKAVYRRTSCNCQRKSRIKFQPTESNQHCRNIQTSDDKSIKCSTCSTNYKSGNNSDKNGDCTAPHIFDNQGADDTCQIHNSNQRQINSSCDHTHHHTKGKNSIFRELEKHRP